MKCHLYLICTLTHVGMIKYGILNFKPSFEVGLVGRVFCVHCLFVGVNNTVVVAIAVLLLLCLQNYLHNICKWVWWQLILSDLNNEVTDRRRLCAWLCMTQFHKIPIVEQFQIGHEAET